MSVEPQRKGGDKLDLYERQINMLDTLLLSLIHICPMALNPSTRIYGGMPSQSDASIPVSYTHLDVYKRQV